MINNFSGKAWKYNDDVDTDVIIPARYLAWYILAKYEVMLTSWYSEEFT